jgi:hypothetical protein
LLTAQTGKGLQVTVKENLPASLYIAIRASTSENVQLAGHVLKSFGGADVSFGGADGIVYRNLKKTEEKPLNAQFYCNLRILALFHRSPFEPFGHPHICTMW